MCKQINLNNYFSQTLTKHVLTLCYKKQKKFSFSLCFKLNGCSWARVFIECFTVKSEYIRVRERFKAISGLLEFKLNVNLAVEYTVLS